MPKTDDPTEQTEVADSERIRSVVETANAEDEKPEVEEDEDTQDDVEEEDGSDDDEDSTDTKSEEESDDDDDEGEDDSKKEKSIKRTFENLADDDDAKYIENIERAYKNSTSEALRLSNEMGALNRRVDAILTAAEKDPDLAKRLNAVLDGKVEPSSSGSEVAPAERSGEVSPLDDPFLVDQKTKWEETSRQEVEDILNANPEIASDPMLNTDVKHWMNVFSQEEFRKNKRLMSGGEAMLAAMKHLGIEDRRTKQEVASRAKEIAAPVKKGSSRKPKGKTKEVSDLSLKLAGKMGLSRERIEKFVD